MYCLAGGQSSGQQQVQLTKVCSYCSARWSDPSPAMAPLPPPPRLSGPATCLDFVARLRQESRADVSLLYLFPCGCLNHRADPSVRVGVLGGNSGYRVRPGYSKFLHFILSSPRQEAPCEAGLTGARQRRRSLPSGKAVNQTGRIRVLKVALFGFYICVKI